MARTACNDRESIASAAISLCEAPAKCRNVAVRSMSDTGVVTETPERSAKPSARTGHCVITRGMATLLCQGCRLPHRSLSHSDSPWSLLRASNVARPCPFAETRCSSRFTNLSRCSAARQKVHSRGPHGG